MDNYETFIEDLSWCLSDPNTSVLDEYDAYEEKY